MLTNVDCEMVLSLDEAIKLIEFRPDEVERLAQDEHDRWVEERQAAGWTSGPQKAQERRFSPSLDPWTELSEEIKDDDRQLILRLPANLAKADYAIRRISGSRQSLSKEM